MVMEAPPSPQSVGREFVRQYYTLLNQAPTHLHRFYNHQSSFVHGGLDPPNRETSPVVGQKQIHQKIQQLNFRDCHAKITQVDSQATLGNGVVVQVTGELSNGGQPMRRFTQTFVLAAQSPKKYYVHNDIFRYQDEIISEEDCDNDTHSEPEEDVVSPERQVLADVQQITPVVPALPAYYANATPIQANIAQIPHHPPHVLNPQVPTVNGAIHPDELNVLGQVQTLVPPAAKTQGLGAPIPNLQQAMVQPSITQPQPEEVQQILDPPADESVDSAYNNSGDQDLEPETSSESVSNEPKTYANLLKSGNTIPPYHSTPQTPTAVPTSQPIRNTTPPLTGPTIHDPRKNMNNRSGPRPNQARMPRQDSDRRTPGRIEDEERRRSLGLNFNNSDINQLFLGNLPHTATEDELRDIFNQFGPIADLKIHSKPVKSGPPGPVRAPPNYGFITYENSQSVQKCLQAKPIYYPKDDKFGTLLNVEEKKLKDRNPYASRPIIDNNRSRGDNLGGQRRSMGPGGPNNRNNGGGGGGGPPGPNRNNTYNRSGGPTNRGGPNNYNNRR